MENEIEARVILYLMGIRASQNKGYLFGCPHNRNYNAWGFILGSPTVRNHLSPGLRFTLDPPKYPAKWPFSSILGSLGVQLKGVRIQV